MLRRIPAVYMRGGTSKGLFFHQRDLPEDAASRDRLLLSAIGSPDPYGKQIDGMGGATSSTSKVVIISPSDRDDADIDYLFGHVAISEPIIDYSGNCGNLTAAVAHFAIEEGLVKRPHAATDGIYTQVVSIWQVNTRKHILAEVPCRNGLPLLEGDYRMDGVPGTAARIRLSFLDPSAHGVVLPTFEAISHLPLPEGGTIAASLVDAGNPTVFVRATDLGLKGSELPDEINGAADVLTTLEFLRAQAAFRMGLVETPEAAALRPATPKISFVAEAQPYRATDGSMVLKERIHLSARILSMGRLHHAYTGTGAVSFGVAAAIPGTLVHELLPPELRRQRGKVELVFGHPAGSMEIGAEVEQDAKGTWQCRAAVMGRTARRLMEGNICLSQKVFDSI